MTDWTTSDYLPIQTNSGILASIYHIIFAVTVVFLFNRAADKIHNATPSE